MAIHELTLPNLKFLDDGRLVAAFQAAIRQAADDCEDRPTEKKARVVNFKAEITPVVDEKDLESVNVDFQVEGKLPSRKSKTYNMKYRKGGKLVFNDLSPNDASQRTLDEAYDDEDD